VLGLNHPWNTIVGGLHDIALNPNRTRRIFVIIYCNRLEYDDAADAPLQMNCRVPLIHEL
jgi:hypothetical protein